MKKFLVITMFLSINIIHHSYANSATTIDKAKISSISKSIENWLKGRYKVDSVKITPMPGILEVRIGNQLVYTDINGDYVIVEGHMIDLKTGSDLTAARMDKIFTIDFESLPLDLAIETKTGDTIDQKRIIAVFEDPFCGYCKKYRKILEKIDNLTIYTFLLPIISEKSSDLSKQIWCSENPAIAWTDLMLKNKEPLKTKKDCIFPKEELLSLGRKLGINATPTSYLVTGRRIAGAVSKENLESELSQISKSN